MPITGDGNRCIICFYSFLYHGTGVSVADNQSLSIVQWLYFPDKWNRIHQSPIIDPD
jgi:hypothetical protein